MLKFESSPPGLMSAISNVNVHALENNYLFKNLLSFTLSTSCIFNLAISL